MQDRIFLPLHPERKGCKTFPENMQCFFRKHADLFPRTAKGAKTGCRCGNPISLTEFVKKSHIGRKKIPVGLEFE